MCLKSFCVDGTRLMCWWTFSMGAAPRICFSPTKLVVNFGRQNFDFLNQKHWMNVSSLLCLLLELSLAVLATVRKKVYQ